MHFVVREGAGAAWVHGSPMRAQPLWPAHAAFMNGLAAEGLVALGGPLGHVAGGRHEALLVLRAASAEEARTRLQGDPWIRHHILLIDAIHPWEILLGELPTEPGAHSADAIP